jgi:hypothetical protein
MMKPGRRPIALPENKRRAYSKGFEAELRRQADLQDDWNRLDICDDEGDA